MSQLRQKLTRQYGALFTAVANALFEEDPMHINYGNNVDEYDSEAGSIIPRLSVATSEEDVQAIVFEEFCHWFDADEVGERARYQAVSLRIWEAWNEFKASAKQ